MKTKVPPHNKDSKELNQSKQKISQSEVRKILTGNFGENRRGEMENNFISKGEFEQYEKRIDEKFNNLNSKIDDLPKRIDEKIQFRISEMKNTQMKWFIATLIALAGLAGRIFGLY
ncbi:hypothetical protein PZL33_07430 [Staphylococcus hominis]|uniref:hypothetical protein n=1 Tax=Staphylococcus hominis TaxID=1290 RepID=UPI00205B4372|nr:hypothetical protein [Staphylococcus hominis]MDH9922002.1 hypothetical protein [Staphylococcus hominis]MDH9924047.1 hypothetical protein [Staphylococcus hominis]MDH9949603.1 hypothetical protein [Staphylococcus hominis]DAL39808.1 MAG TPA_asm: Protein of unknown function (DUF1640) [Caudoviricetes sp.]